jgi:hypothetical protein
MALTGEIQVSHDGRIPHLMPNLTPHLFSVMNLRLIATIGSSDVRPPAKKSDMLLTIMAHHRFRMGRQSSPWMFAPPWTALAASVCAFARQPEPPGVVLLRRQPMPDCQSPPFWLGIRIPLGGRGYGLDLW